MISEGYHRVNRKWRRRMRGQSGVLAATDSISPFCLSCTKVKASKSEMNMPLHLKLSRSTSKLGM